MAKLLAYADCSFQVMLSHQESHLCDCNQIVYGADLPIGDQPDKQKQVSIHADWKYTITKHVDFNACLSHPDQLRYTRYIVSLSSQPGNGIFQPPRA